MLERGPNASRAMAQPQAMRTAGVRHAETGDEAMGGEALLICEGSASSGRDIMAEFAPAPIMKALAPSHARGVWDGSPRLRPAVWHREKHWCRLSEPPIYGARRHWVPVFFGSYICSK
jgi:hypothetical protein